MRVLLTGSTGLIGGAAVGPLLADRHELVVAARRAAAEAAPSCAHARIDLLDDGAADAIVALRPDAIVHCAAAIPRTHDGDAAREAAALNERMDDGVLAAAVALSVPVVYCSSASVYAAGQHVPVDEDTPPAPRGPYAESKLRAERRLLAAAPAGAALRITAPYGRPTAMRTVLQLFVERALRGEPLLFHGSGSREQDFVHADDVGDAIRRAVAWAQRREHPPVVLNVAAGRPVTMRALAELVVEVTGSRSEVRASGQPDPQEGQPARFSVARAEATIGWTPRTPLARGVAGVADAVRRAG